MEDVNKSLLGFFKNGDKLNLSHYSDAAHKNKITDFSYFLNNEDETIPCYTVIYYKDKGPVSGTVYKVTFDYNTPEGKSVTGPSSFTAKKGHAATLETPKCEGYNFVGWFDGDKKVDTKYVVSKNVTLKAHWSEINSEEVNVEINKPEDKKPENNKSEDKKTETITSEIKKPADNKEEVKKDEVVKKEELNPILIKWRSSMSFNRYKL